MKHTLIFLMTFSLILASCSSPPARKTSTPPQDLSPMEVSRINRNSEDSSIDIQYILGRDHYRLTFLSQGSTVTANTYLERQLLAEGLIDVNRYSDFLVKATRFLSQVPQEQTSPESRSHEPPPCRNPFVISIRLGKDTQTARGCRSQDGGALSKLVNEGEFLLYSKN